VHISYDRMRERLIDDGGVGMMKRFISKKKLIGTLASTVALAAPLVLAPSQYSYAYSEGELPSVSLDKIHTIVLPKNGVKYFDFHALYDLNDIDDIHVTYSGSDKVAAGFHFGMIVKPFMK
jgi:hypothetical protein